MAENFTAYTKVKNKLKVLMLIYIEISDFFEF